MQDNPCDGVMQAIRLPKICVGNETLRQCRDMFVLCDFHAFGGRPLSFHSHSLAVHIASVLAKACIRIPDAVMLIVGGGTLGEEVYVCGSAALRCRARPRADIRRGSADVNHDSPLQTMKSVQPRGVGRSGWCHFCFSCTTTFVKAKCPCRR